MKFPSQNKILLLLLPLLLLGAVSCNVHEWYEEEPVPQPGPAPSPAPVMAPVTLNLNFDTDLPLHKEVTYSRSVAEADMRYTVQIFNGSRSKASAPARTLVFTAPAADNPDLTRQIELADGDYEFYVWADYVDSGSTADKYYDTTDWEYLVLPSGQDHTGCEERRDAFRGTLMKTVVNSTEVTESNTVDIAMARPLARFEFVATDYNDFISRQARAAGDSGDGRAADIDPDDYIVVFQYNGFMPSAYNVYTDRPNDAWTNVQFRGAIEPGDDGNARMGFDYVFVNGSETSVTMVMAVFDKQGNQLSQTSAVDVPLARGKNTVVKGEFLSEKASGGVGIQPGFDGDYNIEIDI